MWMSRTDGVVANLGSLMAFLSGQTQAICAKYCDVLHGAVGKLLSSRYCRLKYTCTTAGLPPSLSTEAVLKKQNSVLMNSLDQSLLLRLLYCVLMQLYAGSAQMDYTLLCAI